MFQLFGNIQAPIYSLASAFPQLVSAYAAVDRLLEVETMDLDNLSFIQKKRRSVPREQFNFDSSHLEIAATTITDNIKFNHVYFSYVEDNPILDDISLNINAGETIGLIGPSGEGKTTIIRLLLSLIYADKGSITIDGQILNVDHRNLISYVPQGNTLFSGTILENLKFGNPNATEEEINKALKMSSAYDFVNSLDNKLNTVIGEKGLGISEGQAQRLTIARALLRKKPILILDEATSSLDSDTEVKVLDQIKNLNPKPICIIITHRPSALAICNKIYKLENKKLHIVNLEK